MRKLLNILICLLAAFSADAQGLNALSHSNPGAVILTASDGNSLFVVSHNESKTYRLSTWNGNTWKYFGNIPNLPSHGSNPDGEFALRDAIIYQGDLFITGEYYINSSGNQTNLVYRWNGTTWNDVSNNAIRQSESLRSLDILHGNLILLGIFESEETNLLEWQGSDSWTPLEGWLTLNRNKDYITNAKVYNDELFVSGRFTRRIGVDPYFTAVLNSQGWTSVTHPPFLFGSGGFSSTDNGLALFGTPNTDYDHFKRFNGSGWDDISQGMSDITVNEIWDMQGVNGVIYATGIFKNSLSQKASNIIKYDGTTWSIIDMYFSQERLSLESFKGDLFVYGAFTYQGITNIAKLSTGKALITGYVYLDQNNNCEKDDSEMGVNQFVVRLNPGEHIFWTDNEGYFSIPVEMGKYTIDIPELIHHSNTCGDKLEVDVTDGGNYGTNGFALSLKEGVADLKVKTGFYNGLKLVTNSWNKGYFEISNSGNTDIDDARFEIRTKDIWSGITFNPTYDFVDDNRFTWIISNLKVGESIKISISAFLKKGINKEDLELSFNGSIVDDQSDVTNWNNSGSLTFEEVETIEPIYKQCGNGRFFNDNKPLSYYIRFSNVGNSTVNNIIVRDTIDEDVYISRLGIEYYTSHDADFSSESIMVNGSYYYVFAWDFENIDLKDSASSEDYVGFINLNLNLKEGKHPSGTVVCNEAEVFFDQQEPYATNQVCTESRNISTPILPDLSGMIFYPNPLDDKLVIQSNDDRSVIIEVFSADGRLVYQQVTSLKKEASHEIQTSTWSSGVYLLKFNGSDCHKLIVQ